MSAERAYERGFEECIVCRCRRPVRELEPAEDPSKNPGQAVSLRCGDREWCAKQRTRVNGVH